MTKLFIPIISVKNLEQKLKVTLCCLPLSYLWNENTFPFKDSPQVAETWSLENLSLTSLSVESYIFIKFGQKSQNIILESVDIELKVLKQKCESDFWFSWDTARTVFVAKV